jgi:hypothetical protein
LPFPSAQDSADFAVPQSFAYQRDDSDPATTVIIAVDLTLTPDLIPTGKNLEVYADNLTISGELALKGHNVTINARHLVAQNGIIDVSALPPPPKPPRADDGQAAPGIADGQQGQSGRNGARGADGNGGGEINISAMNVEGHLLLRAHGGKGQDGQDGGNGGRGHTGAVGPDCVTSGLSKVSDAQTGQAGGPGGPGGAAGQAGNGGAAGTIRLWTPMLNFAQVFSIEGEPGQAGADAQPGAGGVGGIGGLGGFECEVVGGGGRGGGWSGWRVSERRIMQSGPGFSGPDGNSVGHVYNADQPVIQLASPGRRVIIETFSGLTTEHFQPHQAPSGHLLTQRTLTLRQAELHFLNSKYAEAKTLLDWAVAVTPAEGQAGVPSDHAAEWFPLHARAATLFGFLQAGLDYYGEPRDHAPLAALNFYRQEVPNLLTTGQLVESAYQAYTGQQKTQDERTSALDQTIRQAATHLDALERDFQQARHQQDQAQNAMAALGVAQNTQYTVVLKAQDDYRYAINHAAPGCSIGDVFSGIARVLTMSAEAYKNIATIGAVIGVLGDKTSSAADAIKSLISVGQSIGELQQKVQALKDLDTSGNRDAAKVIIQRQDFDRHVARFDEQIDKVIHSSSGSLADAARNYKRQVHTYLDLAQARNQKAYDYTCLAVKSVRLQAMIAQKRAELDRVKTQRAASIDPMLPALQTFMAGAYHDLRTHIIRFLAHENAAYNYATLQHTARAMATQSIGALSRMHADILSDIESSINQSNTPREPFLNKRLHLTAAEHEEQFAAFRTGHLNKHGYTVHTFAFSLPFDTPLFGSWKHVVANNFTISLPGAKTDGGEIEVDLIHSGRAQFRDDNGALVEFTHMATLQDYSYTISTGVSTGGGALGGDASNPYTIGVSPCTAWLVVVSEANETNKGLDLSAVDHIEVGFSGVHTPGDMSPLKK